MNRAAVRAYPFQVISRFMINRPGDCLLYTSDAADEL